MESKHHEPAVVPFHDYDMYVQEELKQFDVDGTVPTKYRGTAADQKDMVTLGKKQVLRVGCLHHTCGWT